MTGAVQRQDGGQELTPIPKKQVRYAYQIVQACADKVEAVTETVIPKKTRTKSILRSVARLEPPTEHFESLKPIIKKKPVTTRPEVRYSPEILAKSVIESEKKLAKKESRPIDYDKIQTEVFHKIQTTPFTSKKEDVFDKKGNIVQEGYLTRAMNEVEKQYTETLVQAQAKEYVDQVAAHLQPDKYDKIERDIEAKVKAKTVSKGVKKVIDPEAFKEKVMAEVKKQLDDKAKEPLVNKYKAESEKMKARFEESGSPATLDNIEGIEFLLTDELEEEILQHNFRGGQPFLDKAKEELKAHFDGEICKIIVRECIMKCDENMPKSVESNEERFDEIEGKVKDELRDMILKDPPYRGGEPFLQLALQEVRRQIQAEVPNL